MKKLIAAILLCFLQVTAMANENFQKGIELFEGKNYQGARKFFTEVIRHNPEHHQSYYYLGRIEFEEKKHETSIGHFDRAIAMDYNNFLYYFWRGRAHLDLLLKANLIMKPVYASRTLKDFEKAVELNPDDLESRIYLAEYYGQAPSIAGGSVMKSIAQFRTALTKHPQEPYLYAGLGNQYRNTGRYDSSFYFYKKGIEMNPEYPLIHYEMGKAGAISGRELILSEKSLTRSLEGGLDSWQQSDAFYPLGRVREQLNRKELARHAYEKCLEINGDHSECKKALRRLKN
jgi:tetratricopeptide (TPR) repeat protein